MAKTENPIQGKIGNTVFYQVGKQTRARSASAEYKDANTLKQRECRSQLRVATRFYQHLLATLLRDVWRVAVGGMSGSGYNFFMKLNMKVFKPNGKIADFSLLQLAVGMLPNVNNLTGKVDEEEVVTLLWDESAGLAPTRADDRLVVVVLYANRSFSPVSIEGVQAVRGDGRATFRLTRKRGEAAHLYCFFEARDRGAYSTNQYIRL